MDDGESWYGANSTLLKPSHPFTEAAQRPVTPSRTTRYDISLLSNFTRIPAGYRIRISANSQRPAEFHFPVAPTPQELANLAGGSYAIDRSPQRASFVNLPLTTPSSATPSREDWGPSS